ncbi:MAG TPA: heavy metal-responsive transcriptional regulator [Blastocatellia bacterium]|nr:heavy metal-responsive transcriptional regulator [Blastocatellia bacterium]
MSATMNRQQDANTKEGRWLKIGEVSARSGVGIEALRFYERMGLLGRPARSRSGYRLYDEGVFDRLAFIKQAQMLGFSLTEIARLIAEKEAGQSPCAEVREIVRRRLQELDEKLKELRRYRNQLAAALAEWDAAGDVEGHICGLIEGAHVAQPLPDLQSRKGKK